MAGSLAAPWLGATARLSMPPCHRPRPARRVPRRPSASWDYASFDPDEQPPPLPASSPHVGAFEASEFELVRRLGALSYRSVSAAAPTLSWTVRDEDGGAPDALRVAAPRLAGLLDGGVDGAAPAPDAGYTGGVPPVAAVALYAGRYVGGPGPPAPVLLKEHLRGAEAVARRELAAYAALASPPALAPGAARPRPFSLRPAPRQDETEPPLAPVLGWFMAPSPGAPGRDDSAAAADSYDAAYDGASERDEPDSLWVVQRWETLRTLAEYPAAPQAAAAAAATAWWPPVRRVADAPGARRARFVATAAARAVAALAYCHARRVAHGALDARALLLSTADDAAPGGPGVRLANFGFAVTGAASGASSSSDDTEAATAALAEAARGDCRALGLAIAELVFSALSLEGPGERTSAEALGRLLLDVFAGDVAAGAAFAQEEPAWAPACALLAAADGAGWRLVAALLDQRTYSADADDVAAAAEAFLQVVRVE